MNYLKRHLPFILSVISALLAIASLLVSSMAFVLAIASALFAIGSATLAEWYARITEREMFKLRKWQGDQEVLMVFQVDCEKAKNGEMSYADLRDKYPGFFPPVEEHQKLRAPLPRRSEGTN